MTILTPFLSLIYPPRCATCKTLGTDSMCSQCIAAIVPIPEPFCKTCGQSIAATRTCGHCNERPPAFIRARSLGSYEGVLRHAIHLFKYRDRPQLDEPLGLALAQYVRLQTRWLTLPGLDIIVPVPMHPARRRIRGYNQSERLAQVVSRQLNLPIAANTLKRAKNTRPQVGLTSTARQTNLADAFQVTSPTEISGKTILLIDDVSTTGSTLHECANVLKLAGVKNVYGLTLAAG